MNPRAVAVEPLEDYKLLVTFSNDEIRLFDVEPYLKDKFWSSLSQKSMFITVKIAGGSVEWENEVDFCPDDLYEKSILIGKKLAKKLAV